MTLVLIVHLDWKKSLLINFCDIYCKGAQWFWFIHVATFALYLVTPCIVLLPSHSTIVLPSVLLHSLIFLLTAVSKYYTQHEYLD